MVKKKPPQKRTPVPEGKFATADIVKLAESKGLKVTANQVIEKVRQIRRGKEP